MTNYGRYQQFCNSVGVQPMSEMYWNAFSDSIKPRDVSGIISKAAMALFAADAKALHNDRQITPTPQPKLKHIRCKPTRTIKQRDFHARNRRRLHDLQHIAELNKPNRRQQARAIQWDANGQRKQEGG